MTGIALFIAGKITFTEISLPEAIISVAISSLFMLIPYIGGFLSLIAFFFLLKYFTRYDIWPDLILLTVVSKLIVIIAILMLLKHP